MVRSNGPIYRGPYFLEDEVYAVTVNGARYRQMIEQFLVPEINLLELQNIWFQLDGVLAHTARETIDVFRPHHLR